MKKPVTDKWSYLIADHDGSPLPAMRHNATGIVFYMATAISLRSTPVCTFPAGIKKGRGWCQWKKEEQARAEYERLLAIGEISMRCEFCRIEGRAFIRGLCPNCSLLCWTCGEAATLSEMPSGNYRAGNKWAAPPATFCAGCFAESELKKEAHEAEIAPSGITEADIPF